MGKYSAFVITSLRSLRSSARALFGTCDAHTLVAASCSPPETDSKACDLPGRPFPREFCHYDRMCLTTVRGSAVLEQQSGSAPAVSGPRGASSRTGRRQLQRWMRCVCVGRLPHCDSTIGLLLYHHQAVHGRSPAEVRPGVLFAPGRAFCGSRNVITRAYYPVLANALPLLGQPYASYRPPCELRSAHPPVLLPTPVELLRHQECATLWQARIC
jgi:hypothetical protein